MTDDPPARPPLALWAALAGLALAGFCFGVWAGTQKPPAAEVARADDPPAKPAPEPAKEPPAEPVKESPKPEPKKVAQTPKKGPAAKKEKDERVAMAEPKPPEPEPGPKPKPAEPKPPEPKPEPKKVEPKKPDPKAPAVTFAKDIAPIFRANCVNCHGGGKTEGGLNLASLAAAVKGGDGGPGVKAPDPDASPIWQRIEDMSMPPSKKLTDKDMKLIKTWIESGAK